MELYGCSVPLASAYGILPFSLCGTADRNTERPHMEACASGSLRSDGGNGDLYL